MFAISANLQTSAPRRTGISWFTKRADASLSGPPPTIIVILRCLQNARRLWKTDRRLVLCYGRTRLIDDTDSSIELYDGDFPVLDDRPSERYGRVRRCLGLNNAQMGLIRLDVLRHTRLERKYPAGDMVFMAELALLGPFALLPDVLFHRRMSKEAASRFLSRSELQRFIDPAREGTMNHWRLQRDYVALVACAPIAFREKWRCLGVTARHAYWDGPQLWQDLRALFVKQAA